MALVGLVEGAAAGEDLGFGAGGEAGGAEGLGGAMGRGAGGGSAAGRAARSRDSVIRLPPCAKRMMMEDESKRQRGAPCGTRST